MRRRLLSVGLAALLVAAAFSVADPATAGCKYKGGGKNSLPTNGLPVLVYGYGDMSPKGYAGVGDGTSGNYAQISGDASGIQIEMNFKSINANGYANTGGQFGGC